MLLQRLLGCEGVKLEFTPEAIKEIAAMAEQLNKEVRLGIFYIFALIKSVTQNKLSSC